MAQEAAAAPLEAMDGALTRLDDLLATCVHCGFCVPTCPTWDLLREENDSPRGRLYLMQAEAQGRVDPGGAFALHLGRCLGCRACESVCPAGVPYGHLLEQARTRIPVRPMRSRLQGWILDLLTKPELTRWTYRVARLLRDTGLAGTLAVVLPGRSGSVLRLLAASRPELPPAEEYAGGGGGEEEQDRAAYCLLEGCVMDGLFGHVHQATRRTLAAAGYREVEAQEQRCCGALHAHAGRMDQARELARINIEAFETVPDAWIVSDSAGCGAALRDYPAWFEGEAGWRERALAVAERSRDVTELLAEAATELTGVLQGRAAYDAPCHLHHAQGITRAPLSTLERVEGLEVEALPSSERCCGGAGLYNLAEPDLAALVRAPKLEEIGRGDYDWVITGNPGCLMYIGAGLRRAGIRVPVVHPVELLDRAWNGAPERAQRARDR